MVKNIKNSPKEKCVYLIHMPFGLLLFHVALDKPLGGKTVKYGNTVKF